MLGYFEVFKAAFFVKRCINGMLEISSIYFFTRRVFLSTHYKGLLVDSSNIIRDLLKHLYSHEHIFVIQFDIVIRVIKCLKC